jgi:hypothetical protein
MDIATLLETHRKHTLEAIGDDELDDLVARAHDRATTRTLLDLYRAGQTPVANGQVPVGQAKSAATASRQIKPGSKRAKERAAKAKVTRLANLAAKQAATITTSNIDLPAPGGDAA